MAENLYDEDIIPSEKWDELYSEMPEDCRKFVDEQKLISDGRQLGRNEKFGWFIMETGCLPISDETKKIIYLEARNKQLEEENQRLRAAVDKFRSELSSKSRALNRMHRDNYETVHFDGRDE